MIEYREPEFDFRAPLLLVQRADYQIVPTATYRNDFMRDRDRVLYCNAFRRLSGKTQIYLTGSDDHRRNRLTHTLEVSQIARTISKALKLDCELTEAIALAHDLGHAPFGHAGEQILHEIMVPESRINIKDSPMNNRVLTGNPRKDALKTRPLYGFKHNVQSVRMVTALEDSYGIHGLNLTNYTLWGIEHHSSLAYKPTRVNVSSEYLDPTYRLKYSKDLSQKDSEEEAWSFEAFVVAQADEIAQWHHDLEDALRSGAMTLKQVCEKLQDELLIDDILTDNDRNVLSELCKHNRVHREDLAAISHIVVNNFVTRIIDCSIFNLELLWKKYVLEKGTNVETERINFFRDQKWSSEEIKNAIGFRRLEKDDGKGENIHKRFSTIISENIHHSYEVERMNAKGQYIIRKLFQAYFSHPQQLPDPIVVHYMVSIKEYQSLQEAREHGIGTVRAKFAEFSSNLEAFTLEKQIALMRHICDYIAGMTDHYAVEEYGRLYE